MLIVLELEAAMDGGAISTTTNFQMLSFFAKEDKQQVLGWAIGLFLALAFVTLLSILQVHTLVFHVCMSARVRVRAEGHVIASAYTCACSKMKLNFMVITGFCAYRVGAVG